VQEKIWKKLSKRILFIIDTLQTGGAEKSLLEICSRFKKYQAVFFTLFPGEELKAAFEKKGIAVKQFHFKPSYQFSKMARHIAADIQAEAPLLIHSTLFRADMVARQLKKQEHIPLVNSLVNNSYSRARYHSISFSQKLKLKVIQYWDAYTSHRADAFIANSDTVKQSHVQALGIAADKIQVIYRGRDAMQFSSVKQEEVEALWQTFNTRGKTVFLNVSRLLPRKAQLDLISAFHKVYQKHSKVMLLIAGEGDYRATLQKEIQALGLSQQVLFLGNRRDIPVLLKLANYFVFPSRYEGLPGALIEAMLARTPIIASAIPENLECVSSESALLFPAGDVQALAAQMFQAMQDTDWQTRTEKAYAYALQHFEINNIAAQYEDYYDALLMNSKRE
jgi:glycosyltransferase involved in cell wall biosynthesis